MNVEFDKYKCIFEKYAINSIFVFLDRRFNKTIIFIGIYLIIFFILTIT
jgi:hypothetical protein